GDGGVPAAEVAGQPPLHSGGFDEVEIRALGGGVGVAVADAQVRRCGVPYLLAVGADLGEQIEGRALGVLAQVVGPDGDVEGLAGGDRAVSADRVGQVHRPDGGVGEGPVGHDLHLQVEGQQV